MMTPHETLLLRALLAVLDSEVALPAPVEALVLNAINVVGGELNAFRH